MKKIKNNKSLQGKIILIALILLPLQINAAEIHIDVTTKEPKSGIYIADVKLETLEKSLNALDGELIFDSDKLLVERIYTGKSVVKSWILSPVSKNGKIVFSGIIPGGFSGEGGNLFTIIFSSLDEGEVALGTNYQFFLNDGKGTSLQKSSSTSRFLAVSLKNKDDLNNLTFDDKPPRILQSVIAQNDAMFDGKPFIVVTAKDEESGLSRFEIALADKKISDDLLNTSDVLSWQEISVPSVLPDSFEKKYLYARVIDVEGNLVAQLVSAPKELSPESLVKRLKDSYGLVILVIIIFGALLFVRRFLRRHGSTNSS